MKRWGKSPPRRVTFARLYVTESPHWLRDKGRRAEAEAALADAEPAAAHEASYAALFASVP